MYASGSGFPSLGPVDLWAWGILCRGMGLVHRGMFRRILGHHPGDANSTCSVVRTSMTPDTTNTSGGVGAGVGEELQSHPSLTTTGLEKAFKN